jgi:hypothetical protein
LGIDAEETPEDAVPPVLDDVVAVDLPADAEDEADPERLPSDDATPDPCPWSASSARWHAQASVRVEGASS